MNKLAKIAAVSAFAFSVVQAWEWTLADDGGQVESGGYWFGYDDHEENNADGIGGCTTTDFPEGDENTDIVTPAWQALGGGTGAVTYTFTNSCTYKYPFAGFGFNFFDPKMTIDQFDNPFPGATSIKLYYNLTAGAGISCVVELGADALTSATQFNNYQIDLTKGDFIADGKAYEFTGFKQTYGTPSPWANAYQKADSFKFKCSSTASTTGTASLTLKKIVIGSGTGPIIGQAPKIGGVNLAMEGKTLSVSVAKAAVVQVYSLQGAMVKSQTISPEAKTMSLSELSTGIYMVRIPSVGDISRIAVK